MTDIDLDRLKQLPVPPPRPEARARALAAAMQAFVPAADGASQGSAREVEDGASIHTIGASHSKRHAWRRRETYALAASIAVLAIGLPVAVNHMGERQSLTPEPVAVVQKEVARREAVTLLPQTAAEMDTAKVAAKAASAAARSAAPSGELNGLSQQAPVTGPAPAPTARALPNAAAAPTRSALAPTKPAATAETPLAAPGATTPAADREFRSATNIDPKAKTAELLARAAPAAKSAAQLPRLRAPWTKICGREVLPDGKPGNDMCHVMTWISDGPQSGLFAAGVRSKQDDGTQAMTLTLEFVHPAPDLQVMINGVAVPLAFKPATCTPDACLRETALTPETLATLYREGQLTITSGTPSLGQRSVVLSLQGLTAAMVGPKNSAADAKLFLAELEVVGWRSAFRDHRPEAKALNGEQARRLLSVPQLFAKRIKID